MDKSVNWLAYMALLVICLVWGTTYLFLRIGVENFPAFLFSAIRLFIAGSLLLLFLKIRGKLKIEKTQIVHQIILGFLMLTLGNGVVGWSEKFIPSGLAALIVSILPVYILVLNFILGSKNRVVNPPIILGVLFGCLGIFLIFKDNLKDFINPNYFLGTMMAFGACLSWALGSIYTQKKVDTSNILTNASLQMFFGGLFLFIFSMCFDDYSDLARMNSASIGALVYLTFIGSIVAYPCYVYALDKLPIGVVSLYAYVNPFIALLLGYFLLDEKLTYITFLALVSVIHAIVLINKGYQSPSPKISKKRINS